MATNIINPKTGQTGYQVPGSTLPAGWQWSSGGGAAQQAVPVQSSNNNSGYAQQLANIQSQAQQIQGTLGQLQNAGISDLSQIPQGVDIQQYLSNPQAYQQQQQNTQLANSYLGNLGLGQTGSQFAGNPQAMAIFQALSQQQNQYKSQQEANLGQLSQLQAQLAGLSQPSSELVSLRQAVQQQQRALKDLTPGKYLENQPGLKNIGVSQGFLERRVAQEREPIAGALADLLTSESIFGEEEERRRKSIQDQIQLAQQQFGLQNELYQMSQPQGLQKDILSQFLGLGQNVPTSIQEYQYGLKNPGFAQQQQQHSGSAGFTLNAGDTRYQLDPKTGQYVEVASVPKGTTPPTVTKFTSTQLNKGAANSGMDIQSFQALPHDVKNVFVNNPKLANGQKFTEFVSEVVSGVQNGQENATEVIEEINSSNLPQDVKNYLIQRINAVAPQAKQSGGFFSNLKGLAGQGLNKLANFLGL